MEYLHLNLLRIRLSLILEMKRRPKFSVFFCPSILQPCICGSFPVTCQIYAVNRGFRSFTVECVERKSKVELVAKVLGLKGC